MRRATAVLLIGTFVGLVSVTPASAVITFVFNYTDPGGVGFNHATLGAARQTSLAQTGVLLSNMFPGYTATIILDVNGAETTDGVLAAAGSNFNGPAATCTAGFNRGDVGIKALGGADPSAGADGSVTVNFEDNVWDLDDAVAAGAFDFKSTMLHELLHAMGFSHSIMQNGQDGCGTTAPAVGGWVAYDEHLGNGTAKVISATFVIDTAAWLAIATGGAGPTAGTLWRGTNGTAANGGNPVPLYSPGTYSGGSSISHTDDDFFTGANAKLMNAAAGTGPGIRILSNQEVGILMDIGYSMAVNVPVELQSFSIE